MDHDVDLPGKESLRGPDKVLLIAFIDQLCISSFLHHLTKT